MQSFIDLIYLWLDGVYGLFSIKLVTVILIVFLGFVLGKIIEYTIRTLVKETPFEKDLKNSLQLQRYPSEILAAIASYLIDFFIFASVLYVLDLTRIVFYSLLFVALLVLAIFVLLNLKEFGPNFYAYYRLVKHYHIKKGTRFMLQGVKLKVSSIDTLQVTAVTEKGDVVTVYNRTVLNQISKRKKQ